MLVTYYRSGRLSLVPALAAIAAAVVLAGVTVFALVLVGGAAFSVWLGRALGRAGRAVRRVPAHDPDVIEGVVVDSSDVSDQLIRLDSDKG